VESSKNIILFEEANHGYGMSEKGKGCEIIVYEFFVSYVEIKMRKDEMNFSKASQI
jgi:hypothetical protein